MEREGEVLEDGHRTAVRRNCVGGLEGRAMSSRMNRPGSGIETSRHLRRRMKMPLRVW